MPEVTSKKRCTLVLLMMAAVLSLLSFGGAWAESNVFLAEQIEQNTPFDGSLNETQPCLPSATYRFSNRTNRTISAPGTRIRPWTPVALDTENSTIEISLSPEIFELPEGVKIKYTDNRICTTPARAGPEYIFS